MGSPVAGDPGTLATVADFVARFPELSKGFNETIIAETLVEATDHIESVCSRRLAPFTNYTYQDRIRGIDPSEYGESVPNVPLPWGGTLGMSYANALGDGQLARHFWLDQFAPFHPELWTYNIHSVVITLTYGNTLAIDFANGGMTGPAITDGHCFVPGTRVLNSQLEWVPIETLRLGDTLVGFDETTENGPRQYKSSTVEGIQGFKLQCYEVEFDDGSVVTCSDDHLWLVKLDNAMVWRRTDELRFTTEPQDHPNWRPSLVSKPFQSWEHDTSNDAGYLAAAFDGEGSYLTRDVRLSFCQRENPMLDRVRKSLSDRGFIFSDSVNSHKPQPTNFTRSEDIHNLVLGGGRLEVIRFLGSIRPERLLPKFDLESVGQYQAKNLVTPVRITPVGKRDVVALQTSTRTYLAEGFAAHNCWLRIGTFVPLGSRVDVVYDGGYTLGIPPALKRACLYQAAKFLIIDAEPQFRTGMNLDELDAQLTTIMASWARG